ncbi:MAG: CIA30 family protein [Spirochaetia bacterium]|nr:CIA30 family protein [Spirochaetia bacterium]
MKKYILALIPLFFSAASVFPATATITVNYSAETQPYNYRKLLGNNLGHWLSPAGYTSNIDKIKAAGCYLLRFPGGSISNEYHWNGTGTYDEAKIWHPDNTSYSGGFLAMPDYRGSSSLGYGHPGKLTDNDTTTMWVSETITAAACTTNAYAIVRFTSAQYVDSFKIYWGDTYATDYELQYWSSSDFSWAPHQGNTNYWVTVSSVTGNTGGTDTRAIIRRSASAFRILMKKSSSAGYKIREIELYDGAAKRTVNANDSSQTETAASPTDRANTPTGWHPDFDFETYITLLQNIGADAIPAVSVNFGTGTPEEAAAWVHYANVVRGLGIKYWQIGNEMEGIWESGGPVDAEFYTKRFIEYAQAMKAVDPSIKICGPVLSALKNNSELYDGRSFLEAFLHYLQAAGKSDLLDVVDFHIYANWSLSSDAAMLNTVNDWYAGANYKTFIDNLLTAYYGSATAKEVFMSEHNSGNASIYGMGFAASLWVTNWLMEYARAFGSRSTAALWDVMNNNASTGNYDHGFLEIGQQTNPAYRYQQRATYWGMYMINNYFGVQEDNGNTLVAASSSRPLLPVYAAKRSDGKLSVLVINKDSANAYTTTLNITGYTPDASADVYTFASAASSPYFIKNYEWHESNPSSYADPDIGPYGSNFNGASNSFVFTFPAYSMSVFQFVPAGSSPTITPSISPTASITPTITITSTSAAITGDVIENNELLTNTNNLWGGYWYSYAGGGTGAVVSSGKVGGGSPLTPAGAYYTSITMGTGSSVYGGFGTNLNGRNLGEFLGISLYARGNSRPVNIKIETTNVTDFSFWQYTITPGSSWQYYEIPFSSFTHPAWGITEDFDLNLATQISFGTEGSGLIFDIYVDDLTAYRLSGSPTNTPTGTPTRTNTPSLTFTRTATVSFTASITPTVTLTATQSMTLTISPVMTDTQTPTPEPSGTVTPASASTFTPTPTTVNGGIGLQNDLSGVYLYPSLLDAGMGDEGIWFYGLPKKVRIQIMNLKGNSIYDVTQSTPEGKFYLQFARQRKKDVFAPGVYVYIISDRVGNTVKGKFAVVR